MNTSKQQWPSLPTDEAAERFVEEADLSRFDWGAVEAVSYEFEDKSARVTMRLPESQLERIKAEASKRGIKYQRFMRELMERGMQTLHPR
ncbi:CopG family antitoxin [uncultured Thalassospira sp.]|jgi:predicted DNA binding CopG/RHH family protein|uniref:CopG family antitoxin n=1 Tax=uncultured Thalassospira sp. TaxID=404382 RepID=UPI0030D86EB8|tara:strand:- start:553 stop:822 length:270 start_codon:yes stop_codon:yes gene_type:complete